MYIYPSNAQFKTVNINNYNKISNKQLSVKNKEYIDAFKKSLRSAKTGRGLFNKILKQVPLPEMHLSLPEDVPSETIQNGTFNKTGKYSFCGPGTKVAQRLKEGYEGVNSLDKACKKHDIYYSQHKSTKERNTADDVLANAASKIALDPNEEEYVRKDAKLVTGIMGMKSRFGMGSKNGERCSLERR